MSAILINNYTRAIVPIIYYSPKIQWCYQEIDQIIGANNNKILWNTCL